nr:hypothetical protein [Mycobacterium botniense]
MRRWWRVLAYDIAAPLATIAGLVMIGIVLRWPPWWVSACSTLVVLIIVGAVANFVQGRGPGTIGTNDQRPWLRLVVVIICTTALLAAVILGYFGWTVRDRELDRDTTEVVRVATAVAEAMASFSPVDPAASLKRAEAMMLPESASVLKDRYEKSKAALAQNMVTAESQLVAAGVLALRPPAATVVVVMRGTQSRPDVTPIHTVIALRMKLAKKGDRWLVADILPAHVH